ncbi:MAG: glycosyltransferase family 4 protein [Candidatus Omnitrophica bacterium]|nr:glycosyltransferase family 4 protein [Candidatus Omnitrophota bacterium]
MKILIVTTHLDLGGIGVYTLSLSSALKEAGIEVVVASSGGSLAHELERAGIEHITIPVNTSSDIGFHTLISVARLSSLVKERGIDIVHAQTRVSQVIAYFLCRKTGAGFVSTCHGFFKMKWFRHILPCWGERTIAVSEAVRQHLVCDLKVPKERISTIHNGIDPRRFNPDVSAADKGLIRKQYCLGPGPVVGIVSRLSKVKGHKYLIGAFAKLLQMIPDAQLLIIGDGARGYKNSLVSLASDLGVSSKTFFYPSCKDTTIPLSVIDIFCHPSLQEGLGLSILEAMAMRLPVIASNVGGIYTLIKHRINGLLVPAMNECALAEGIAQIISDPDMARRMGIASRQAVLRDFTLDIMRDKVIEVYEQLIRR